MPNVALLFLVLGIVEDAQELRLSRRHGTLVDLMSFRNAACGAMPERWQQQLRAIARLPTHITHVSNQELLDRLGICEPEAHILHNMEGQLRRWRENAEHDHLIPKARMAAAVSGELTAQLQQEQKAGRSHLSALWFRM